MQALRLQILWNNFKFIMREKLSLIHKDISPKLCSIEIVNSIIGIGSFFREQKAKPNDLDYYLILAATFDKIDIKKLSDKLENIKDTYKNDKYETLINIFLEDTNGDKLNSVDLWFVTNFNESLSSVIKERKSQIWRGFAPKVLFLKQ